MRKEIDLQELVARVRAEAYYVDDGSYGKVVDEPLLQALCDVVEQQAAEIERLKQCCKWEWVRAADRLPQNGMDIVVKLGCGACHVAVYKDDQFIFSAYDLRTKIPISKERAISLGYLWKLLYKSPETYK